MARKLLILFTLVGYMLMSTGVGVSRHYCHGHLASASLLGIPSPGCICEWLAEIQSPSDDCCSDELEFFQVKTPHQQVTGVDIAPPIVTPLPITTWEMGSLVTNLTFQNTFTERPADPGGPPLFIQYHSWELYG